MEQLDSLNGGLALTGAATQRNLTAKGMQAGLCVDKFYLKLICTMTAGAAAVPHTPQAISEILQRLIISHGRMNWNVQGRIINLFDSLMRMSINSMSPNLAAAAPAAVTVYTLYIPIDPSPAGPPFRTPNLFRTEELQNAVFNLTLANPFDAVNDITTLLVDASLWVSYREVPKNGTKDWVSVFRQLDTFEGNVVSVNDIIPSLWIGLGESPTNFGTVTIDSTGLRIARQANMVDLDTRDYYYQALQPLDAANLTQGGDQFLRDVPRANAVAENYHKVFDGRNDEGAALPIVASYDSVPATFGYAIKGVAV